MKYLKLISMLAVTMGLNLSAKAASEDLSCIDGTFRILELGRKGQMTARGFLLTLQTARVVMDCRPEAQFGGLGVWQNWYAADVFKCLSATDSIRLVVTRTGAVTTAQVYNRFNVLIFNGLCRLKR